MLAQLLFRPLELFLNRGLEQSAAAQGLARELEGRTLGWSVVGTLLDLRLRVSAGRLLVALPDGAAPDACLRGSVLSLGRLLREDPQAPVRDGSVQLTGDTELAERFGELLRLATPDLEQELSRLVGDLLARQVGNATRAFADWSATTGKTVERGVAQFLQEQSRMLPTRAEIDEFSHRVDTLVNDVARAEARIERLKEEL